MVILARKNSLLDKIEVQMVAAKIPILKHLGISLLDKAHIKDFMAFLTILVNNRSTIHWRRVLALHPTIGIIKANNIIEYKDDIFGQYLGSNIQIVLWLEHEINILAI